MGKFIQLHALRVCNVPNSDEGFKDLKTMICLNTDYIAMVRQIGSSCVIYIDAPICSEDSEYNREGYKWKPQSSAAEITVEELYEDVVKMINN